MYRLATVFGLTAVPPPPHRVCRLRRKCLEHRNQHGFSCQKQFQEEKKSISSWPIEVFEVPLHIRSVYKTLFIST